MPFITRTVSGTTDTPDNTDDEAYLLFTNAGAKTLDLQNDATKAWYLGAVISGVNLGAGALTINPNTSVNINGATTDIIVDQYQQFTLVNGAGVDDWSLTVYAIGLAISTATIVEVDTGTNDAHAITPLALAGSALQSKVDGVEASATADQTGAEIKAAYEVEANAYTDTKNTKLSGIEASADVTDTANVTAAGAAMLTGATFTGDVTSTDFIGPLNGPVQFTAKNTSGGTITKGQAIAISGISGNTPTVTLADADDASSMPAFGLAATTAADNNNLEIVTFGSLKGIQTDYAGWALGDTLYISTTAGALTNTPPAGEGSLIQNIGSVERLHSSNGTIKVGGAGRSNATPNLDDGNVFIGNASNQSSARALVVADTTDLQAALDGKQAHSAVLDATTASFLIADETKLDNIETAATADQTAAEVVVTPAGNLASTDVQAALTELQDDIDVLVGGLDFQGVWNASTNTPALVSSVGTIGHFYKVSTTGTTTLDGVSTWTVGDALYFGDSVWNKIDNTDLVSSVAGKAGAVTIQEADITDLQTYHVVGGTDIPVADGGTGASTASGARTALDVDQAGTDNAPAASDTVAGKAELATITEINTGTDTTRTITPAGLAGSALQTKVDGIETSATADQTGAQIKTAYELEANAFTDAQFTKLAGVETLADVTDATNVTAAGALMDSEVDADLKTLVLPASTTISTFGASLVDDADATTALATLGAVSAALFPSEIVVAGSDEVTAIVAATGVMQFRMPYAMTGTEIRASLGSACTTGTFTVDVNIGGATVLSTKLTVDATEKTSETAATAPVLSDTAWADDEIVTVDVDVDGDATATGLKVTLIGTRSV